MNDPAQRYVAVYMSGLNEPVEIAFCADQAIDPVDPQALAMVEEFITANIDFDCRRLLFFYHDLSLLEHPDVVRDGA